MSECEKRRKFLQAEMGALKNEFEKRRIKLERRYGRPVSLKEAEQDFMDEGLENFAEGFRTGFCADCEKSDECESC